MRILAAWWLVAAFLVIAGCSGGGGGTCTSNCVTSVLSVGAVTPTNGATGVAITSTVTATFGLPLSASTNHHLDFHADAARRLSRSWDGKL